MLTEKQELFVRKIIEGESQADAYRAAYNTQRMTDKSVWEKASRLMSDDKVRSRVKELRDKLAEESIMTAEERLRYLTRIVRGEEREKQTILDLQGNPHDVDTATAIKTRLNALDIMNKMTGEYELKVKGSLGVKLEDLI